MARDTSVFFWEESAPDFTLVNLRLGQGDSHNGGRSVSLLEFDNGCRCLYKPRSVSVDRHFRELVEWFNQYAELKLSAARVLGFVDHGWVEYVPHIGCDTTDQVTPTTGA